MSSAGKKRNRLYGVLKAQYGDLQFILSKLLEDIKQMNMTNHTPPKQVVFPKITDSLAEEEQWAPGSVLEHRVLVCVLCFHLRTLGGNLGLSVEGALVIMSTPVGVLSWERKPTCWNSTPLLARALSTHWGFLKMSSKSPCLCLCWALIGTVSFMK